MAHVFYFTLANTERWSVWQGIPGAKGILRARAGKEGTYSSKTSERAGQEAKHWNERKNGGCNAYLVTGGKMH